MKNENCNKSISVSFLLCIKCKFTEIRTNNGKTKNRGNVCQHQNTFTKLTDFFFLNFKFSIESKQFRKSDCRWLVICFAYEFSFKKMVIVHVSNKHIKCWVFSMPKMTFLNWLTMQYQVTMN